MNFYQRVFGLPLRATQGTEADWSVRTIPVLAVGTGPQFIASARGAPPSINHSCLGMEAFDAGRVVKPLAHGVEAHVRIRADSDPPVEEPTFPDPDGILVQIQDVGYCGGSGVLGDLCDPDDRP